MRGLLRGILALGTQTTGNVDALDYEPELALNLASPMDRNDD